MIKKYIIIALTLAFLFSGISFAFAQEENGTTTEPTIQQLLAQIQTLTTQIQTLQQQVQQLLTQQQTLKEEILALTRQLQEGMRGEDIKLLQQLLATDTEIYPEGLITGYFGPMTKRAVQRFQERAGIDQVGRVGPQTLERINQIFQEGIDGRGVGLIEIKDGVFVPPGLLKAPGIQRLLGEKHPLIAECSSIKPCPEGYYCLAGKCVECAEDEHCAEGYVCLENECVLQENNNGNNGEE